LHLAHLAARAIELLNDGYAAALHSELDRSRQASNPGADHDNAVSAQIMLSQNGVDMARKDCPFKVTVEVTTIDDTRSDASPKYRESG
jgi:hypothetical protein